MRNLGTLESDKVACVVHGLYPTSVIIVNEAFTFLNIFFCDQEDDWIIVIVEFSWLNIYLIFIFSCTIYEPCDICYFLWSYYEGWISINTIN